MIQVCDPPRQRQIRRLSAEEFFTLVRCGGAGFYRPRTEVLRMLTAGEAWGTAGAALLVLVYAAGAMAAMYITYTPVGMVRIVGLQARYFLCVWLALLPALAVLLRKTIRPAITEEKVEAAITPLCACYAVLGAVLLFQHYFVGPVYVVYA